MDIRFTSVLNVIFVLLFLAGLTGCFDKETSSVAFPCGAVTTVDLLKFESKDSRMDAQFTIARAGEMQIPLVAKVTGPSQCDSPQMKYFWEMCERYRVNQLILTRDISGQLTTTTMDMMTCVTDDSIAILEHDFPCRCQFKGYKLNHLMLGSVLKHLRPHSFNNLLDLVVLVPFTAPCEYHVIDLEKGKWEQHCVKNKLYCQFRFVDSEEIQKVVNQKDFSKESLLSLTQIECFMEDLVNTLRHEKWNDEIIVRESWTLKERYRVNRNGFERIH